MIVEQTGPLALLEGPVRAGQLAAGLPPGGPADRHSAALGNRLCGNPDDAVTVEFLLGGARLRATADLVIAVTGAPAPVTVDGRPATFGAVLAVPAGSAVEIGTPSHGLRTYLCVRGGIADMARGNTTWNTSLSSSPLASLGPPALQAGDDLTIGQARGEPHVGIVVPPVAPAPYAVRAAWGPRAGLLSELPTTTSWRIGTASDRVGVRLEGTPLTAGGAQLPSEPIVRGAVQLPPSGLPVVFLADHPTTGGYPVIAIVDDAGTDLLAQARPGDEVRLAIHQSRLRTALDSIAREPSSSSDG